MPFLLLEQDLQTKRQYIQNNPIVAHMKKDIPDISGGQTEGRKTPPYDLCMNMGQQRAVGRGLAPLRLAISPYNQTYHELFLEVFLYQAATTRAFELDGISGQYWE